MILTDDEMREVRSCLEAQAGLDEELMQHCGHLIRMGAFDEAIRSAFVLLEGRLRKAVNKTNVTGTNLAQFAFNPANGPLAMLLAEDTAEREGLRDLYVGAFKLFRNPTAHGVMGYSPAEGKSIIGFLNLLLGMVKRAGEVPPPGLLPENLERVLAQIEKGIDAGAASRLRSFLVRCVQLGLRPSKDTKVWIPFRRPALIKSGSSPTPKRGYVRVFYVTAETLGFPLPSYSNIVVGFDAEALINALQELEFQPDRGDWGAKLKLHNDQPFFDRLFDLVRRTSDALEDTLEQA
jgi:hypothetical protein